MRLSRSTPSTARGRGPDPGVARRSQGDGIFGASPRRAQFRHGDPARRADRHRARETQDRRGRNRRRRGFAHLHLARPVWRRRRLARAQRRLALDLGGGRSLRRRLRRGRILRRRAVEPRIHRSYHRSRRHGRVRAGRHGHARPFGACHRSWRRHRGGARLQAAAARLRRQARLGRCLCRLAPPDRDLHRASTSARSADRPVGRAQPLRVVVARDPDLRSVARRLCVDAAARTEPRERR